jgi:hypothetical protein
VILCPWTTPGLTAQRPSQPDALDFDTLSS